MENFDVVIIGAGIAGVSVARELAKYNTTVAVIERRHGIGLETTSANMALVCQGGDALTFRPGTLHAELNVKSIPLWPKFAEELGVPFKRVGGLGLIRNKADFKKFMKMYSRAFRSSIQPNAPYYIPEGSFKPLEFLDRRRLLELEPNINPTLQGALFDPNLAVTDPIKLANALAENASANGVVFLLGEEVKRIERGPDSFIVDTGGERIRAGFIVNAAGVDADRVAEMVPGARDFSYVPVKGVLVDFDEEAGKALSHQAYFLPRLGEHVKAVVPIVYGGLRVGIYLEYTYRTDHTVPSEGVKYDVAVAREIVPNYSFEKHVKRVLAGIMAYTNPETGWHDFIIDIPDLVPRWVNIILGPAGISAAPMLGKKVVELLAMSGLKLEPNSRFSPTAKKRISSGG